MSIGFKRTRLLLAVVENIVAQRGKPVYGSSIIQAIKAPAGSVYPALKRLTEAGWLAWEMEPAPADRPGRKLYTLTPLGQREAIQFLKEQ